MNDFAHLSDPNIRNTEVIEKIVRLTNCQKYLELGVWYGKNITKIKEHCKYSIGVDFDDKRKHKDFTFIKTTVKFINLVYAIGFEPIHIIVINPKFIVSTNFTKRIFFLMQRKWDSNP